LHIITAARIERFVSIVHSTKTAVFPGHRRITCERIRAVLAAAAAAAAAAAGHLVDSV